MSIINVTEKFPTPGASTQPSASAVASQPFMQNFIPAPSGEHAVKNMGMYMPTLIALIAYIILAVIIILPFDFPVRSENGRKYIVKYNFWQRFLTILLMIIPVALSLYTINCLMSGNCVIWSYAVTAVTAVWVLIFAIMAALYTWSPKKQQGYPTTTHLTGPLSQVY
jgi:hypothetical protein